MYLDLFHNARFRKVSVKAFLFSDCFKFQAEILQ